ncbi:MAG: hypothetical protein H6700_03510 [Myxococcales bacterium]|nr:hypothetical protein [Myxococcales bacterium]MCB9519460.1 hypothetical protein [Myxococcales bacterium]MCB9530808.1 hypothetical protein [Myxococcales bacterium]
MARPPSRRLALRRHVPALGVGGVVLTAFLGAAATTAVLAQRAQAQPVTTATEDPLSRTPESLSGELAIPRPVSSSALESIGEAACAAVFPVRVTVDLGEDFHPRTATGDGVATWLVRGDAPPALVTSNALVAGAVEVTVWIDGAWNVAEVRHATPMFDLAELVAAVQPAAAPLTLATRWPAAGSVYVPAETALDRAAPDSPASSPEPRASEDWRSLSSAERLREQATRRPVGPTAVGPPLSVTTFGRDLRHNDFYLRTMVTQHNGYPVMGADGTVVGLLSYAIDDRFGGVATIPFAQLAAWFDAWPQLDAGTPLGWRPREEDAPLDLDTEPLGGR